MRLNEIYILHYVLIYDEPFLITVLKLGFVK
jgi:hypothetical protein